MYLFIVHILAVRVFANGPGDLGSIPGRVIPKTQKMVLDASLLNTQHYKVRIKGKEGKFREGVAPSPTPWCSSYRKGSLRVTLDYGRQLYLLTHLKVGNESRLSWWNRESKIFGFSWSFGFYGISTFVGYLMSNPFLYKWSVLFQTIQFSMSTQFNSQKDFYFKLFSLIKQFWFKQFSLV